MKQHLVAALYKFVSLDKPSRFKPLIEVMCDKNGIMGTLLLAKEGINGTISGDEAKLREFLAWLRTFPEFQELDIKESWAKSPPFYRMKVRLKKEIVTLGADGVDAANDAGTYVRPEDWNDLISDPDTIVIDTRNDYEVAIGSFKGAVDPGTKSFRDLPDWVDERLAAEPDTKIAMFCTGGIRCEKSTALLKSKGYESVYHLRGGILKYLETIPEAESLWQGECFVFDQRVSVKHGLVQGQYDMCHACRMPIREEDKNHKHYQRGVSCHHCFDTQNEKQRQRFAERERQMQLANKRGEKHIAADIGSAKQQKRQEQELQRERSQGSQ